MCTGYSDNTAISLPCHCLITLPYHCLVIALLHYLISALHAADTVADLAIGLEGRTAPPRPSWLYAGTPHESRHVRPYHPVWVARTNFSSFLNTNRQC